MTRWNLRPQQNFSSDRRSDPEDIFLDSDPDNPVGAEYTIIERVVMLSFVWSRFRLMILHVPGECAQDVWDSFSKEQKSTVVEQLAGHMNELLTFVSNPLGLYIFGKTI